MAVPGVGSRPAGERQRQGSRTVTTPQAGTIDLGGDLTVHRLGFGAMRVTGDGIWGEPKNRDEARAVLRRAVELGVDFIDTADSYGPDVSETLIAEALHPYPENLVIATKGGLVRPGPGRWEPDGRPEHLRRTLWPAWSAPSGPSSRTRSRPECRRLGTGRGRRSTPAGDTTAGRSTHDPCPSDRP